ncbi:hypothetical protein C1H46_022742 [Malus baccata]|uniref:Uncharacterized protein n=1 Tax=Malus baccata TaxID=106549 RepID=A0A540LZ22_MALBA|nr:hypothetical protein C1H46_022742 [Malus baccata]
MTFPKVVIERDSDSEQSSPKEQEGEEVLESENEAKADEVLDGKKKGKAPTTISLKKFAKGQTAGGCFREWISMQKKVLFLLRTTLAFSLILASMTTGKPILIHKKGR